MNNTYIEKPSYVVQKGDNITINVPEAKQTDLKEQNISNDSESKIFLDGIIYGNFDTFDATNSVEAKKKFQPHRN